MTNYTNKNSSMEKKKKGSSRKRQLNLKCVGEVYLDV